MTRTVETKWFRFRQNNSGGVFRPPAVCVYVEALDAAHANSIAERLGIYFDGAGDCSCCGNRWWPVDDSDALAEEPTEEIIEFAWGSEKVAEAVKLCLGADAAVLLPFRKRGQAKLTVTKTETKPEAGTV